MQFPRILCLNNRMMAELKNLEATSELFIKYSDTHPRSQKVPVLNKSRENLSGQLAELHDTGSVKWWLSPTTTELLSKTTLTDKSS